MGEVHELQTRAARCRKSGFTTPVVSTVDEARELAQRVAGLLSSLSDRDALICLVSLHDVQTVLTQRVARLEADITETRRELQRVQAAGRACRRYGAAAKPRE